MPEAAPTLSRDCALAVRERPVTIAHLAARRGSSGFDERVAQVLGTQLPRGSHVTQAGVLRLLGISPGRWLVLHEGMDHDFCADLAVQLRAVAAVCELSDAYAVLELRGVAVRRTLAKLIAIDLHEQAFVAGQVAATVAAHIPVTLWRAPDTDGAAVFELAVPRSYAQSLREALDEASAEYLPATTR